MFKMMFYIFVGVCIGVYYPQIVTEGQTLFVDSGLRDTIVNLLKGV